MQAASLLPRGEKDRMRGLVTHRTVGSAGTPSPHPSPRWGEGGVGGARVAKWPVSRKAVGIVRRLRRAGVRYALLGEARLGGAVQLLRRGLVLAALLGEAVQGGAVQAFAGRLDGAAVVGRGGGYDAKRSDDDGKRFHFFPPWIASSISKQRNAGGRQACGCSTPPGLALSTISGRYCASNLSMWATGGGRGGAKC